VRPVNQLADQRRLVAIGERIDHARRPCLFGEQGPGQHVGFNVDHDDVLFRGDRRAGVDDARSRHPCRFDNHFDFRVSASLSTRGDEHGLRDPRRIPTDGLAGGARSGSRSAMTRDRDARHSWYLCQIHRAEFAGADQSDPHQPTRGSTLLRDAMEVHDTSYSAAAQCPRA
jgi:hypothetical protein